MPMDAGPIDLLMMLGPALGMIAWAATCLWAIARVQRMEIALVSQLAWGLAIVLLPLVGLVAFLLVGDRTPQIERELGIRRLG
ncbi:hypothetical protein [Agrococcus sp. Marseille-P2731]|uniref:hypothetical protein n=1 Tax=Agrococcus sp. Marseille-P2731 TaxID=1841862 RepID=UPI00093006A7|nr:hypothetical protein [Agrococcus sp. Marseille-P2731]